MRRWWRTNALTRLCARRSSTMWGHAIDLIASDALASVIASGAKLTDQMMLINSLDEDAHGSLPVATKRIGGRLLFGRMEEQLGIAYVRRKSLGHHAFGFTVERAVFVSTLHELFIAGSDRDYASWIADYGIHQGLELHRFYRATAWLGEDLEEKVADAMAPRCVRGIINEKLFGSGYDPFTAIQLAVSRVVEGPRFREARAAVSWRLWAVRTVGLASYDARTRSGQAKLLGPSYRSDANLHTDRLLSASGGLLYIGGSSRTENSSAASDIDLASNACTFAWSGRRPSGSIGLDVAPKKQGGSLLRSHAGNGIVKTEARRRISRNATRSRTVSTIKESGG